MSNPDLRVKIRLKNNRIASAREALGLTATAAAELAGISLSQWIEYENLKASPVSRAKNANPDVSMWRESARKLATALGEDCEYLFPESLARISSPSKTYQVDSGRLFVALSEARGLATEQPVDRLEICDQVTKLLAAGNLTERETKIVVERFGLGDDQGRTLSAIGEDLDLSKDRIRQIEAKAIRKLRWRAKKQEKDEEK